MGNDISNGKPEDLLPMKKYQGMTIPHIVMLKDRLDLLANEDLTIDKASFQISMKTKAPETARLFQMFDLSNDGKIETSEFICSLALMSHATLKEKCRFIFGLYDFDKNRTMTKNELIILIKTVLTSLNAVTGRGECTISEADLMADEIMNKYDTNKDDDIQLREFQSFVSKDPNIIKMLLSYGLISMEDLRFNFGYIKNEIPDADSDLENEIYKSKIRFTERHEKICLGIEHSFGDKNAQSDSKSAFPWLQQVKDCAPSHYEQKSYDSNSPAAQLQISYVYGFRSFDTRNNLKYSCTDELVYHSGAIGICLDSEKNQQRFFMEHSADITCIDVGETFAVTGQMGRDAMIFVWDLNTRETKAVLKGLFKIGISNLAISNDQTKLIAIGMDDNKLIGIYDLEKATSMRLNGRRDESLIASCKGPRSEIFDIKFDKSDNFIVIACQCEVNFVTYENQSIKVFKGSWEPKICALQSLLSVGILDNSAVTGTFKGQLILWRGNRTTQIFEAHKGPVMAIHTRKHEFGIITAGKDGMIMFWDGGMKLRKTISLTSYPQLALNSLKITAICESKDGSRFAIGTRGGDIVEFINNKPKKSMTGHFEGHLKGLCCHPHNSTFYTVGEDSLLFMWDSSTRLPTNFKKLEYQSKTMDISNDGKYLAIGCHNGNTLILDPITLIKQFDFKDRDSEISFVKFSPDNEILLCAYSKPYCEIFIYNVNQNFKRVGIVDGLDEDIMNIDFGRDNMRLIMVADWSRQLSFVDISDEGQQIFIPNGEQVYKDMNWSTYRSIFGWHIMGIYPDVAEGNEINAVDRAKHCNVLVTADDYSGLKLFRFPAHKSNQSYNRFSGHSGHVSNVRFTHKDEYVISLGGEEKSIIQWKFTNEHELQNVYEKNISPTTTKQPTQQQGLQLFDEDDDPQDTKLKIVGQNKPYLQQIVAMVPEKYDQSLHQDVPPQQFLSIQYVVGMRIHHAGKDVYNVLRYSSTGKMVFPAAGLVVVQDPKVDTKTSIRPQTHFVRHTQEVISLAMHPKGSIVASGTAAPDLANQLVEIMLWDVETMSLLCFIQDFHIRGVSHLAFSPDGTILLTIGMDDDHSLALYDWQINRLMCTSKVDKSPLYDIGWDTNLKFFTTGEKHFKFWTIQGRNLKAQYANFRDNFEPQTAIALAFGSECVSGSNLGNLFLWKGNTIAHQIKAHEGQVNILLNAKQNLYSAGSDGRIVLWNLNQNQLSLTGVVHLTVGGASITSLDLKNDYFAIMTKEGGLWQLFNGSSIPILILSCHHSGDVSGLAIQPKGKLCLSVGSDKMLRKWDFGDTMRQGEPQKFEHELTSVDWSQNGKFIIVGDKKGYLHLLDSTDMKVLDHKPTKFKSSKANKNEAGYEISDLKVSPDSMKVAFGGKGGPSHVEIWNIEDHRLVTSFVVNVGFTGSLTHLDWSRDSNYIVATSETYELKFISYMKQKDVSVNQMRDTEWFTWTCVYGYQVQGIYPYSQGNDVGAVCRSNNKEFMITGDNFGMIRLFNYPAPFNQPIQQHRLYSGHQGKISSLRFMGDRLAISAGREDRTLIIWQIESDQQQDDLGKSEDPETQLKDLQVVSMEDKIEVNKFGRVVVPVEQEYELNSSDEEVDEEDAKLSNFINMKPWVAGVKEPTSYYKEPLNQLTPPMMDLQLDYAHGYRSNDCRNNVKYLKNGSIVYHTASLGIVMDIVNNMQKFFKCHTDDITCLDLHSDGIRVATGEIGTQPTIYVWDSNTLIPLCKFSGQLTMGVCSINFSSVRDRLCAVAIDTQHEIAVYEINTKSISGGSMVTKIQSGLSLVIEIKWISENQFISIGPCHFKKWTLSNSGLISQTLLIPKSECQILMNCALNNEDLYIGDNSGRLQYWKNLVFQESYPLHDGKPLEAIYMGKDLYNLDFIVISILTGGRDQRINILYLKCEKRGTPFLSFKVHDVTKNAIVPEIRSIQLSANDRNILIGTYGGEIWELSTKDVKLGQTTRFNDGKSIVKSHFCAQRGTQNQIWGLALNPVDADLFYTCGDDMILRAWSISQRKMVLYSRTDQGDQYVTKDDSNLDSVRGSCLIMSPDGSWIVVGFKDGSLRVFDKELKQKSSQKAAKDWISDMKFNPEGSILAIGSHDYSIYMYSFPDLKLIKQPLRKHTDFIMNIDFTGDGKSIHSTCRGFDLLFWDVETHKLIANGAMLLRDEKWSTWTSLLGWPVQGIWNDTSDGTDINCCDRSNNNYSGKDHTPDNYFFLAVGNDNNQIKVHRCIIFIHDRYPCVQRGSQAVIGRGHSSPVTLIKFSSDDQYLISIGGLDMTILLWKVIKK